MGILKIFSAQTEYSNSALFFWEPRDALRDPVALLKTVEPQSAGELLALRFSTPQSPATHPPRNQGTEVLWHFCADARRTLEEPLRKGSAVLFRFGQMRQIALGMQNFQQSQTASRKEGP